MDGSTLAAQKMAPQEVHGSSRRQGADQIPIPGQLHGPMQGRPGCGHRHMGRAGPWYGVLGAWLGGHRQTETQIGAALLPYILRQRPGGAL